MQKRLITVLLFAIVAAFISRTVLYKIISANSSVPVRAVTAPVPVATRDLEAGAVVEGGDLKVAQWAGAVSPNWAVRREDIVGRGLLVAINAGEPFPENRLALKGAGAGLSSRIPSGMRMVAVHLDESSGLSNVIAPGMRVDVLSTGSASGQSNQSITRTILQNIEILSTIQSVERNAKDKPALTQAVNLLVTPAQAEALSQAIAQTRIQLVLRNPLDKASVTDTGGAGLSSLFETIKSASARKATPVAKVATPHPHVLPAPPPPVPAIPAAEPKRPALPTIEIIHGTKRAVTEVVAGEESGK